MQMKHLFQDSERRENITSFFVALSLFLQAQHYELYTRDIMTSINQLTRWQHTVHKFYHFPKLQPRNFESYIDEVNNSDRLVRVPFLATVKHLHRQKYKFPVRFPEFECLEIPSFELVMMRLPGNCSHFPVPPTNIYYLPSAGIGIHSTLRKPWGFHPLGECHL